MDDPQNVREVPKTWREYIKDSMKMARICRWVWNELIARESKKRAKVFLALMLIATVFQMLQPWMMSYIFNGLIDRSGTTILIGFIGFIVCATVRSAVHWRGGREREWVHGLNFGTVDRCITKRFFEKTMGQHLQEGSQLNVANVDKGKWRVLEIQNMLIFEAIPTFTTLIISYLLVLILSPIAWLIMTGAIALHFVWSLHLNQRAVEACTPIDAAYRKLNRHRVERWEHIERVKTCGKEEQELKEMDERFEDIITPDRKFWFWFNDHCAFRGYVTTIGTLSVMAYGTYLVWENVWLIGTLYPLFTWSSRMSENIWQISQIEHRLNWNMPSVRSLMDALNIPASFNHEKGMKVDHATAPLNVSFENVSYTYPRGSIEEGTENEKSPVPIISNISFKISAGEKVALIGSSGVGKTTIMRLLLRYMDPDEGYIHINGSVLNEISPASWMEAVGYVAQQQQVFDGTIRYNLTYGLPPERQQTIADEELWNVMRLLKIDFGDRLVDGLETTVGKDGVKLSGGEAQRLMIGAAAIKEPRFMVIDEATSSLDSTTEKEVQHGLATVMHDRISALVVAHRLSTVRKLCDKFIVLRNATEMKKGDSQIEAIATSFEELYEISPTFRKLADDQEITIHQQVDEKMATT